MKIPFVGQSYEARSLNASAQKTLNCYLEMDNSNPRAPVALYGTPGTALRFTLGDYPIRSVISQGDYTYWVAGSSVYKVAADYTATLLGTIGTASGPVGMASNGTEVLIVDGVGGWLATTGTLTQITDVDFPNGVTQAAHQDGFFIVSGDGSGKFYINETPGSGLSWNGTDFASAEGSPDNTIGCISNHRELVLGGDRSIEIWVNTGNADFPFERSGNAFIEVGVLAAGTLAALDNTVYWLGSTSYGSGIVYRLNGYTPERISTHAIERAIQGYETTSDAIAFTYQQEGHSFYVLTFPTESKTWCYDAATGQWHERAYRNPSTGELNRWRPSCHVFVNGENLVGDYENGNVYALDLDTYSDNEAPILRLRRTQCLDSPDGERLFYESMRVDMETGVGLATGQGSAPLLMMRYSNDGGHTWSNEKTVSIGRAGEYGARAKFGPTGAGRNRVWEISMTDPVKFAVFGANAGLSKGY